MSSKKKQQLKQLRVDQTADKRFTTTRSARAQTIATNAPNCAVWQTHQEVEIAGTKVVSVGASLASLDALVQSLEAQLETARNLRFAKIIEFDATFGVYVATVETYATTPQDITALGLILLAKSTYPLVAPLGIEATYDIIQGLIVVRVQRAPGLDACVVEISPSPAGPDTWKRLDGFGGLHKLSGYPPGTYSVRAASARATTLSAFTDPVSVIVK